MASFQIEETEIPISKLNKKIEKDKKMMDIFMNDSEYENENEEEIDNRRSCKGCQGLDQDRMKVYMLCIKGGYYLVPCHDNESCLNALNSDINETINKYEIWKQIFSTTFYRIF